jgi:hypothetical protein
MTGAKMQMILSRGLTAAEEEKFDRLEPQLAQIVLAAGVNTPVVFGAQGAGIDRAVGLIPGFVGPLILSMPASRFLAASDDKVLAEFHRLLSRS